MFKYKKNKISIELFSVIKSTERVEISAVYKSITIFLKCMDGIKENLRHI